MNDRLKVSLTRFVESVLPNFDFYALNPGTVIAPGTPGTFDFQPDNQSLPGLQNVAFRSGIPGVTITVDPATSPRCLLGFEGGDPKAPFLALWGQPGLLALTVSAEASINLSAPVVALGPAWTAFLTTVSSATTAPQIAAAAATLLALIQGVSS